MCEWHQFVRITLLYMVKGSGSWTRYDDSDISIETHGGERIVNGTDYPDVGDKSGGLGYTETGGMGTKGTKGNGSTAEMRDVPGFAHDYRSLKILKGFGEKALAHENERRWEKGDYDTIVIEGIRVNFKFSAYLVCQGRVVYRIHWAASAIYMRDANGEWPADTNEIKYEAAILKSEAADDYGPEHQGIAAEHR